MNQQTLLTIPDTAVVYTYMYIPAGNRLSLCVLGFLISMLLYDTRYVLLTRRSNKNVSGQAKSISISFRVPVRQTTVHRTPVLFSSFSLTFIMYAYSQTHYYHTAEKKNTWYKKCMTEWLDECARPIGI